MYDDEPPRRRRSLVPILAIIAVILALAIAAGVVFVMFGNVLKPGGVLAVKPGAQSNAATAQSNNASPLTPAGDQGAGQTDVPKAIVSVAPAAEGEPPVRSTHGDWQVRCDTPAGAQNES